MTLKEILNKRYDKEFPISGSFGTSIDTPIVLDKDGPSDYVGTEYAVIMKCKTRKNQLFTLLSIVTLTLIMASCTSSDINNTSSDKNNDWKQYNLSGKVKSLKATVYKAKEKFDEIEKGDIISSFENKQDIFNLDGNRLEESFYNSDKSLLHKDEYKYDKKRNLNEINRYDSDGSLFEKTLPKDDENGNPAESNRYDSDENLLSKILFQYDKKGNLNEYNIYDSDGSLIQKYLLKYDKKGNQVELNIYDSDGRLSDKYKYDAKGNQVEMIVYRSDGSFSFNNLFKYDKKGNLTEKTSVDKLDQKHEYKYEYEFDNKGNWINRIEFKNNIPNEIIEREIEYFD